MARIALTDYWFYLNEVLQYRWMDDWLHGEEIIPFIDRYESDPGCLLLVPRGHGKSGCITAPRLSWWLAKNPIVTCVVTNATEPKANQMARVNANIIANNETYKNCFPEVRKSDKWGDSGYFLDLTHITKGEYSIDRIDPSIGSYGVGGNVTGPHWSGGCIFDDIVNLKFAKSPAEMRRVHEFYSEVLNTVDDYVPLVAIGTRWDYLDIYADLISGAKGGKHGPLEQLILGIKNDDGHYIWPRQTYFDMSGRKVVVGWDDETNKQAEQNAGPLYSALYWNKPVRDTDRQFDISQVKNFLKDPPFRLGTVAQVGVEVESQAANLVQTIREIMRKENRSFAIEKIVAPRTKSKHDRIRASLQHWVSDGQCNVERTIWVGEKLLGDEMKDFPKSKDDCLDAFAYATSLAHEGSGNSPPRVYIVMDPAFTTDENNDATAIVAVCKYNHELWALACDRFQTSQTEIMARRLFLMVDRFNSPRAARSRKQNSRTVGFGRAHERGNIHATQYDDGFYMEPMLPKGD